MKLLASKALLLTIIAGLMGGCSSAARDASTVVDNPSVTAVNSPPVANSVSVTRSSFTAAAQVSDTLSAHYTYSDVDGDIEGVSTFHWLRNNTVVGTALTYTLTTADVSNTIKFEVTPVAKTGALVGVPVSSSGLVIGNAAPMASNVTITSSNAVVGSTLTTIYVYADAEGDAEGVSLYRWMNNGTTISGETAKSYTVKAADLKGKLTATYTVEVTPVAATGTTNGLPVISTVVTTANNSAPTLSNVSINVTPAVGTVVAGQAHVNDVLTANYIYNDVDGDAQGATSIAWYSTGNSNPISTGANYTVVKTDAGKNITAKVTPIASSGVTPGAAQTLDAVSVVNSAPLATNVAIVGTPIVTNLLTASYAYNDVDGDGEGITTFKWKRNGVTIAGETAKSYTLGLLDSGKSISVEVTPIALTGVLTGTTVVSAAANVAVVNSAPTATNVAIVGTPIYPNTLSVSYVYNDVDGDLEGVTTFQWKRNNVALVGMTNKTYPLGPLDVGQSISVMVTPVAATGASPGTAMLSAAITPDVAVGGTVFGLAVGARVELQNNGGDNIAIITDGAFTFPTGLAANTAYNITVFTQPTSPAHACTVVGGSGTTTHTASITSPKVYCTLYVTTLAGSGANGAVDATGTAASFNHPTGVAVDAAGNVYVADYASHKIRKITSAGVVTTLAGSGTQGAVDATGTVASFNNPTGVAVDAAGNVYVADQGNQKIRKITSAGVVTTLAGSGAFGAVDATGTAASFNAPSGIAVDAAGNIYVGDYGNHKIRKITSTGVVTTLAGSGTQGTVDATGTAASFNQPWGVAVDAAGNVYVADFVNHKIRKITPAGVVTTLAGSGTPGAVDATGTAASFTFPQGVAVDAAGNVYVTDRENQKIRKITSTGVVTTLAGSGTQGTVDATGTAASFSFPNGIAVDAAGNVYVADQGNQKIRKIIP